MRSIAVAALCGTLLLLVGSCVEDNKLTQKLLTSGIIEGAPEGRWDYVKVVFYSYINGNKSVLNYRMVDVTNKRDVNYNGMGPDGQWFTADDNILSYSKYHLQVIKSVYKLSAQEFYDDPGPDGQWFTEDDRIYMKYLATYDAAGNRIQDYFLERGADMAINTADDPKSYSDFSYDAGGNWLIGQHSYFDGITTSYSCDKVTYDANGNATFIDSYVAGSDKKCFTGDDKQSGYSMYIYNSSNDATWDMYYTGSGVDTLWHSVDDTGAGYTENTYDAQGFHSIQDYKLTGLDMKPNTVDDKLFTRTNYTNDSTGKHMSLVSNYPGADKQYGTADDQIRLEATYGNW